MLTDNIEGCVGEKEVDKVILLGLLKEILAALGVLLYELKLIVALDLGCTLKELAEIIAGLLIVCIFVFNLLSSLINYLCLIGHHRSSIPRPINCWLPRCCSLRCHCFHRVSYFGSFPSTFNNDIV